MKPGRDRAYRRRKLAQVKKRVRRVMSWWGCDADESMVGLAASTHMRWCSRPGCCGNSRRIRGRNYVTRQEMAALTSAKEQYSESKNE